MKLGDLPNRRFKLKHIALVGLVCIVALGGSMVMIEATSTTEFCASSCHEMEPMATTYAHSLHARAGVGCGDCHEKPGLKGTIESKWQGTKELAIHITGTAPEVIKMENPARDVNCYTCHQDKMMDAETAGAHVDPHTLKHFENGMDCMTCHSGVVHNEAKNADLPSRDECYTCHLDNMGTRLK